MSTRRTYALTNDPTELERRELEALCFACARPLPEDAAAHRQFCDATCRQRHHRFASGGAL
ncbi:hypothetical protein [Streptomyces thermodiastaticus]|uniref:hypothetical protein n=1 Tax=Streptomyces thermodiastaticus TaxID=44061 RepID=UPI00167298A3|nr:hypothetical protein [Streptomyces thermodiastaticus]GHF88976.1 hypothetical protein GCM10018787_42060 [Streptomyces thermodiastaticus]